MKQIFSFEAEVLGIRAQMHVTISGDQVADLGVPTSAMSEDARNRIAAHLQNEVQRVAEVAGVDQKDQIAAGEEARRIAAAPKDRPSISVAAGTKDADAVTVNRGTFTVGRRTVSAQKGAK